MPKKAAEEKTEKVEKSAPEVPDVIEVTLAEEHPGNHSVYLKNYRVDFVKGVATVPPEVADELRRLGVIK